MTTGWPQDQQDLQWPYSDANGAGPGRQAGGRVATDSDGTDRSAGASGLWSDHPSAPLPVTPSPEPRGRRGRSRGDRDTSGLADTVGDADYDWIRYLGEAGPAQEHSKRPAETRPSSSEEDSRGGRGAGRRSRRHAAPEQSAPVQPTPMQPTPVQPTPVQPTADTDTSPSAAFRTGGHRARGTHNSDFGAPDRVGRDRAMPERGMPERRVPDRIAPDRGMPDRGARDRMPPDRPLGQPAEPAPESWTSGLARPVTSPGFPRPDYSRPPTSRHGITQPNAASTTSAWPASPARPDQAGPRHGQDTGDWARPAALADPTTDHSGRHLRPPQADNVALLAAAGRAAAQSASEQDLGLDRPGGRAASRRTAAMAAASAGNTAVIAPPRTAPGATAPAKSRKDATSRKATRRKARHPVRLVLGGGAVAVVAAAGVVLVPHMLKEGSGGPAHSISTPARLQSYVQDPALAASMGATALRAEIERKGSGEASHVVDAVYEDTTGAAAKTAPQILLFVGGNLSGSAGSFISSFTGSLRSAFVTNPGSLGGQAACVPGVGGHPAECAWADGDTFGLIASPDLSASALASELRLMRPQVEHVVK
jgi:hypothetical protein